MYGLMEYALIRQEMHQRNKQRHMPVQEFDYPVTLPGRRIRKKNFSRLFRIVKKRRGLLLYIRLSL